MAVPRAGVDQVGRVTEWDGPTHAAVVLVVGGTEAGGDHVDCHLVRSAASGRPYAEVDVLASVLVHGGNLLGVVGVRRVDEVHVAVSGVHVVQAHVVVVLSREGHRGQHPVVAGQVDPVDVIHVPSIVEVAREGLVHRANVGGISAVVCIVSGVHAGPSVILVDALLRLHGRVVDREGDRVVHLVVIWQGHAAGVQVPHAQEHLGVHADVGGPPVGLVGGHSLRVVPV